MKIKKNGTWKQTELAGKSDISVRHNKENLIKKLSTPGQTVKTGSHNNKQIYSSNKKKKKNNKKKKHKIILILSSLLLLCGYEDLWTSKHSYTVKFRY